MLPGRRLLFAAQQDKAYFGTGDQNRAAIRQLHELAGDSWSRRNDVPRPADLERRSVRGDLRLRKRSAELCQY